MAVLTLGDKRYIRLSLQRTQCVCVYIGLCILALQQHCPETLAQRKLFFPNAGVHYLVSPEIQFHRQAACLYYVN